MKAYSTTSNDKTGEEIRTALGRTVCGKVFENGTLHSQLVQVCVEEGKYPFRDALVLCHFCCRLRPERSSFKGAPVTVLWKMETLQNSYRFYDVLDRHTSAEKRRKGEVR